MKKKEKVFFFVATQKLELSGVMIFQKNRNSAISLSPCDGTESLRVLKLLFLGTSFNSYRWTMMAT